MDIDMATINNLSLTRSKSFSTSYCLVSSVYTSTLDSQPILLSIQAVYQTQLTEISWSKPHAVQSLPQVHVLLH